MILNAVDVLKVFGGLVAVNDVSLNVEEGEIVGLIGPNGAGKTTFLNCISGALKPDGGTINFLGKDITGWNPENICRLGMSRTFQISRPFPRLSVLENVEVSAVFGGGISNLKEAIKKAEEVLDFVQFPLPKETPAENLNAMQLKLVDLARALASGPKLLLLDELASGLTTGELGDLMETIREINKSGVTIIIVEHIMKVIGGVCNRIAVLDYGTKIAEGTPEEISNNQRVIEAYLGKKRIKT